MPNCRIEIEFYRPDRQFDTGTVVQGWVRVSVDKPVVCRGLMLAAVWQTRSAASPTKKSYYQTTLFQGDWQANENYEYAFEFMPTEFPSTYQGKNLSIEHLVSVVADIPWNAGKRCERSFLLLPRAQDTRCENNVSCDVPLGNQRLKIYGIASAIIAVFGLILAVTRWPWFWLLAIPGLVSTLFVTAKFLSLFCFRNVSWRIKSRAVIPGEKVSVSIAGTPRFNLSVGSITANVVGLEKVQITYGKREKLLLHTIHNEKFQLIDSTRLRKNEPFEINRSIQIPQTDAFSIDLLNNSVQWVIKLSIRLAYLPEWHSLHEIQVLPFLQPPDNPNPAFVVRPPSELLRILKRIDEPKFDPEYVTNIISHNRNQLYEIPVTIDRIGNSDNQLDDPAYTNGKTIFGWFAGTQIGIAVQLPTGHNQQVESLNPGGTWSGCGTLLSWDDSCNRVVVLGI